MATTSFGIQRRSVYRLFVVLLLFALLPAGQFKPVSAAPVPPPPAHIRMVSDINTANRLNIESGLLPFNGYFYFSGTEEEYGNELWRCTPGPAACGDFQLVKDINPGIASSQPARLLVFDNALFFLARNDESGMELWKSDGLPGGETVMVKDINPGWANSVYQSSEMMAATVGGAAYLFLSANDGTSGSELWISDGTTDGTRRVKDIYPGMNGSGPSNLAVFNGKLYFSAMAVDISPCLWMSDGTAEGTRAVNEANPAAGGTFPRDLFVMPAVPAGHGELLVYSATTGYNQNRELYQYDTSGSLGLLKEINFGPNSSDPGQFTMLGDFLFFNAVSEVGSQIWSYDGVSALSIRPVTSFSLPSAYRLKIGGAFALPDGPWFMKDWLFFSVLEAKETETLYRTDGMITQKLYDFVYNEDGLMADSMVLMNNTVYFNADDGIWGEELWATNGTPDGTLLLRDTFPGERAGNPKDLIVVGDRLFFKTEVTHLEKGLWSSSGAFKTTFEVDTTIAGNKSSYPDGMVVLDERVVFAARSAAEGLEPWASDGTPAGTVLLADILPGSDSSNPREFVRLNDRILFTAYSYEGGVELWSTDGTPAGTAQLADLNPGMGSANLSLLTAVNGMNGGVGPDKTLIFFTSDDGPYQVSLWKTDGTAAGTQRVSASPTPLKAIKQMTAGQGILFMEACDTLDQPDPKYSANIKNCELWKSDGSSVSLVKDIYPGSESADFDEMIYHQGWLYFGAENGANGFELWRSNGTTTAMIKDAKPGPDGIDILEMAAVGQTVFFSGTDYINGLELWKTDGTAAGTVMVRDIYPGMEDGDPYHFFPFKNNLYFLADDGVHGEELWKSDGTAAGTVLVKDIHPGPGPSYAEGFTAYSGFLYFTACDADSGCELWFSKGSAASTYALADIWPGLESSWPYSFQWLGSRALFVASDGVHGGELWAMDVPLIYLPMLRK